MPDIDAKKIEELLPCPFCGGAAQAEHFESKLGRWRWSIGCNDHTSKADDGGEPAAECYGFQSMTSFATKAEAIAAWNRRASHSLASASGGEDSPAGILDVQRMLTIHQPKGGDANANGSRDASKPIPATSPGVTAGASAVEDDLCGRLRVYALAEDIMSSERRDLETAATRIRSLSAQLAEARRERDDVRIEYGHMGDDYRELETKLRNTFADVQSMKRRVHAAEAEANALRERVGILEKAMNAIGRLAYTQGDRTFGDD